VEAKDVNNGGQEGVVHVILGSATRVQLGLIG
jgi:hypothetical protein